MKYYDHCCMISKLECTFLMQMGKKWTQNLYKIIQRLKTASSFLFSIKGDAHIGEKAIVNCLGGFYLLLLRIFYGKHYLANYVVQMWICT